MDYIYLLDQDCKNFEYLDINNRVNYLMENQKNDLLLIGLEKINFLFLIPKFDKNNCYYFDLFISFKNECMHKNLLNLNFNIISIESVSKIKSLSLLDIKNIFNFDNNKFLINKFDYRGVCTLNIDFNKKKLDIKPFTQEEEDAKMIEFLNECNNKGDINENEDLKLNIKEVLSQFLKKRNININLKKISYFFY
jgi:hypothetical protein